MVREASALADDLRGVLGPLDRQLAEALSERELGEVGRVYVVGSGDSYFAGEATGLAFDTIGGVECTAVSSLPFVEFGAAWAERPLVVAVSASGRTPGVLKAVERANTEGALTVALTTTAGSELTRVAERAVVVELADKERSPGIRTYQAGLLGLLMLAIRCGTVRGRFSLSGAKNVRDSLADVADTIAATHRSLVPRTAGVVELLGESPAVVVGSGPSFGTAGFCAAKLVEGAGLFASRQDVEEWCHIERFARPATMPVFVVAPPGRSSWRAATMAAQANKLGRRVVAVTRPDDPVAAEASARLLVPGEVSEEFSPLVYHLFAAHVAAGLAERLGRQPFQA